MFDQTFVSDAHSPRRPWTLATSLLLQAVAVLACILLSIVFTQTFPVLQLKSILIAPRPPLAAHAPTEKAVTKSALSRRKFVFSPRRLRTPALVRTTEPAPPELLGIAGTVAAFIPAYGVPAGIDIPAETLAPPPPRAPEQHKPQGPLHIGGSVEAANLIFEVKPIYPPLARDARISGLVEFAAIIGKDGRIRDLRVLHGHPLLLRAATQAVLQWRYRPTLLNGVPVEVSTTITVDFKLQ